jgi:hypothetical protein
MTTHRSLCFNFCLYACLSLIRSRWARSKGSLAFNVHRRVPDEASLLLQGALHLSSDTIAGFVEAARDRLRQLGLHAVKIADEASKVRCVNLYRRHSLPLTYALCRRCGAGRIDSLPCTLAAAQAPPTSGTMIVPPERPRSRQPRARTLRTLQRLHAPHFGAYSRASWAAQGARDLGTSGKDRTCQPRRQRPRRSERRGCHFILAVGLSPCRCLTGTNTHPATQAWRGR